MVGAWLVLLSPGAVASTTVSGVGDPQSPLVIDPGSSSGAAEDDSFNVYSGTEAAYIADMPDTRDVGTVKVGQFARTSACDYDVPLRLKVFEAKSTAINPSDVVSESMDGTAPFDDAVSATTTFANLTFHMRPFTMHVGYSYTFTLSTPSGCALIARRYWPHNDDGTVSGGSASQCTKVPNAYDEYRIWHVYGEDDLPSCSLIDPGNFDPTMPTGWLVVWDGYWGQSIVTAVHEKPVIPGIPGPCTFDWQSQFTYWRPYPPAPEHNDEFVCTFTSFSAPGYPTTDGWYYAGRWENFTEPGDPYLELDPLDPEALLEAHKPIYAFDSGEDFLPQKASAFTDNSVSLDPYDLGDANKLYSGSTVLAAGSSPGTGELPPALTLDTLGPTYNLGSSHPSASNSDYIDAHGTDESTAYDDAEFERLQGNSDVVYGRFVQDPTDHKLWLQYWLFYYYNSFDVLGFGLHEGDWEMVQIRLDSDLNPTEVTFSIHETPGRGCYWYNQVVKDSATSTRLVVFLGNGSHASYPDGDISGIPFDNVETPVPDYHRGEGTLKDSLPLEVANGERWWDWPGRWGADDSSYFWDAPSPKSPSEQGDKWTNPSEFDANADRDHCQTG